ncbi:probable DNA double-strand break repair Rad50 ATPase isoform X1 [Zingiber officinale]|uniref:probable DNA double-strand break repair Rad50 ATPase isoform X1 n=1 Tax=Zingiber officinale TaxID=94328 RepID=UPI001C4C86E0|nr:probable DNA double-strand break repair Rad50 ATPase isoform X1 [Zingiber officinale]
MFKTARWRNEKNKIKVVFKLQFQATKVPLLGSETVMVSLVQLDTGKPTARTEKAAVVNGTCNWSNPIYETVKLVRDAKSGKMNEKWYQFLVSKTQGPNELGVLGEGTVNLTDYGEVFKASSISLHLKAGTILHVTIQRIQGELADREVDIKRDGMLGQGQTLQGQLGKYDCEKGLKALVKNDMNMLKDGSHISREPRVKFTANRNLTNYSDSNEHHKSNSPDVTSEASSDGRSELYTPGEGMLKNTGSNRHDTASFSSPTTDVSIQKRSVTSSEWSGGEGSTDGSAKSESRECLPFSHIKLEKLSEVVSLTRKVEVSEKELEKLKKQIVKDAKQGEELLREISSLRKERDGLRRECQVLSQERLSFNDNVSAESHIARKGPSSVLEEVKQELDHERNLNSSLRLQLHKTQEANSELLLAVRDLDELLEEKNREMCPKCTGFQNSDAKQDGIENGTLEKKIIDLNNEVVLYSDDREELLLQMEQLALDYEILKQENHDMSLKLDQMQLREKLSIQYECSAHIALINDLECQVEWLEKQLQSQADSFKTDIDNVIHAKVEQEKKVLQAEEALKETKWKNVNTADWLHEELRRLSSQASSTFYVSEKVVERVIDEANELHSQNIYLQNLLQETKHNLTSVHGQYQMNLQHLLRVLVYKSKETDKLLLNLKGKNEELESCRNSEERLKVTLEKMEELKSEIEKLKMEKHLVSEERENLVNRVEILEAKNKANELMLQDRYSESELLKEEIVLLKQVLEKSEDERNELKNLTDKKENIVIILTSEVEALRLKYDHLKQMVSEGELEKQELRSLVSELGETYNTKEDDHFESYKCEFESDASPLQQSQELARYCRTNLREQDLVSYTCDQHTKDMLNEISVLKRQNKSTEDELKEMQERYSEISWKFAEVEGERQQLLITIRSLKNALKK